MEYHARLTQLALDAREQARGEDALAQTMPGAIKAATPAGAGARLKPEGAEQQESDHHIAGSVRTCDPQEKECEKHESGDTQNSERQRRL